MTKLALYAAAVVFAVTLYLIAMGVFIAPKSMAPMLHGWMWEGCWREATSPRWVCAA